jgi:hypothetical protein
MGKTPERFQILIALVQAQNSRTRKDEACFQLSELTAPKFNRDKEAILEV